VRGIERHGQQPFGISPEDDKIDQPFGQRPDFAGRAKHLPQCPKRRQDESVARALAPGAKVASRAMNAPRILLIIGGGIAAYKACELIRLIRKGGARSLAC
jgi:hypothetical protein